MKRFFIFVFYDKNGVVDSYVPHLLSSIKNSNDKLVIVVNGDINKNGKSKLEKISDNIIFRKNIGFDFSAYKECFIKYVEEIIDNDFFEVIFFNNSFYGPIFPFDEMFKKMDNKVLDFWGITLYNSDNAIDTHIQSYFIAVRRNLYKSKNFLNFWQKLPKIKTYQDAVNYGELTFTKYFFNLGYKYSTFVDLPHLKGNLTSFYIEKLLEVRCPIIKRRGIIYSKKYALSKGINNKNIIKKIQKHSSYNIDFIIENVLREFPFDIVEYCLSLNKIILENEDIKNRINNKLLIIHNNIINNNINNSLDCYKTFCVDNKLSLSEILNNHKDTIINSSQDLICILYNHHNNKLSSNLNKIIFEHKFLSLFNSKPYTQNIIAEFSNNNRLGMVIPSDFILGLKYRIGEKIKDYSQIFLEEKNINIPISNEFDYTLLSSFFIIRRDLLIELYRLIDKFPIYPNIWLSDIINIKILRYLVQYKGFYTQKISPKELAESNLQIYHEQYKNVDAEFLFKSWYRSRFKSIL